MQIPEIKTIMNPGMFINPVIFTHKSVPAARGAITEVKNGALIILNIDGFSIDINPLVCFVYS